MPLRAKRCIVPFLLFFSVFFFAPETLCADQGQGARHALWEVTTDHNTVYLLGSLHLLKSFNYPLADVIEEAFDDSEVIVFELVLDEANSATAQLAMLSKGSLPEGVTLQERLSAETYELAAGKNERIRCRHGNVSGLQAMDVCGHLGVIKAGAARVRFSAGG